MAEICSGGGGVLVRGTEPSAASAVVCDASTRAARRRRMQIRRLRLADGAVAPPEAAGRKRQQLDCLDGDGDASHKVLRRDDGSSGVDEKVESGSITKQELAPLLQVIGSGGADHCSGYGMTSIRGRRRDMEDAVSICPDFLRRGREDVDRCHFFGVYDGHGCSHVATACKDRMHEIVAEEIGSEPHPELKEVLERSFLRMDGEVETPGRSADGAAPSCRCELQTPMCNHVGSTAVVAVVSSDRVIVSNCGDSRDVLCRGGAVVPLSTDHKGSEQPDRPDELQRIQAAGGRVIYWDGARVLGVLAMSRAIGDGYLKPFVSSEPEVTVTERREEDECLILASDGLWDVVTNEMACYIARMCLRGSSDGPRSDKACSDAAMLLTKLALARHSTDNVTAVVVDLRRS